LLNWSVLADLGRGDEEGEVDVADPDDFVVLPNRFVDGWSGREVKMGFNGLPRINCVSGGNFQIGAALSGNVNTFSAFGGHNPRPVDANGFHISGWVPPPVILAPGGAWPPSWWPTRRVGPNEFAPGVPTVTPKWETTTGPTAPHPNPGETETAYMTRCETYLTGLGVSSTDATTMCETRWNIGGFSAALPADAPAPQRGTRSKK
jgi:hypothetical protein